MDELIKSITEKRNKLGWSIKKLAEISKVPFSAVQRIEKGVGFWEDYAYQLNKALDAALHRYEIKKSYYKARRLREIETQEKTLKPKKEKRLKWSRNFENCVNCGTTQIKHRARGLCNTCYRIENERRQKDHIRQLSMGEYWLAKRKLTKEYLIDKYWNEKKSLWDIAKECNCTSTM